MALESHLFFRSFLSWMYGIPAIIVINNSEKHQRLGDMWANTIVVDINDPQQFLFEDEY